MKNSIAEFISWVHNPVVKSLAEIIEFNKEHLDKEMPGGI
jgi:hypothetical protein